MIAISAQLINDKTISPNDSISNRFLQLNQNVKQKMWIYEMRNNRIEMKILGKSLQHEKMNKT